MTKETQTVTRIAHIDHLPGEIDPEQVNSRVNSFIESLETDLGDSFKVIDYKLHTLNSRWPLISILTYVFDKAVETK